MNCELELCSLFRVCCFYLSCPHGEEPVGAVYVVEYLAQMVAVGVGDEYLAEVAARDQSYDLLYALSVEFVEDVVEQQQGRGVASCLSERVELGQLEGDEEGLVLSLAALPSDGVSAEGHLQFVLVYAMQRVAHDAVALSAAPYHVQQGAALAVGDVAQAYGLVPLRYVFVVALERGYEPPDVDFPALEYEFPLAGHRLLPEREQFGVGLFLLLQQGVALLQGFVVTHEGTQVGGLALRDDDVEETATLLAASRNQLLVGGRDDDQRDESDVLGYPLVCFLPPSHYLSLPRLQTAVDVFRAAVLPLVSGLQHHELLSVAHRHAVLAREAALAHRQEVDGIQHVGLPLTVVSDETIDARREVKICLGNVLIVKYGEPCEYHSYGKGIKKSTIHNAQFTIYLYLCMVFTNGK